MSKEYERPTHEEEYLDVERDKAFNELELKIPSETIDCRKEQSELKYDAGKPRYSLVPPKALEGVAKVLTFGAKKYEANSWQLMEDTSRYMDALMRHIEAVRQGETHDTDSGLQHMAHVATNAMFLFEFIERDSDG